MMIRLSPARQLRQMYPINSMIAPVHIMGDGTPIRQRMHVFDVADSRHIGYVISWGTTMARIRWIESDWISFVPFASLRLAPKDSYE